MSWLIDSFTPTAAGAGEKDVIVPFSAVKTTKKNDKWLDETKDDLKSAPGLIKTREGSTPHLRPTFCPQQLRLSLN